MRMMILAAATALALAGCTDAEKDDTFAIVCSGVSVADLGFQIYAGTGKVSQKTIDIETTAVIGAQEICNGPRPANVKEAVAAVQRALQAIADATRQARLQAAG